MSAPDDGCALPASPKSFDTEPEAVVVMAESFDKLMDHKSVKKQKDKRDKRLEELDKEFEKERNKLCVELGICTKQKVDKTSSKLIKRISSKNM